MLINNNIPSGVREVLIYDDEKIIYIFIYISSNVLDFITVSDNVIEYDNKAYTTDLNYISYENCKNGLLKIKFNVLKEGEINA